jgi:hypothetical protein
MIPALLITFFSTSANADILTVTSAQDFYFTYTEDQQFTAQTDAQRFGIDSHLWLYNNDNNQLLASNDDYFGLDSYISHPIQAGITYRLRAGVCCGDPDRWYGGSYTISVNGTPFTTTTVAPSTTTTTIAPYLNSPQSLSVTSVNESKVYLSWDAPEPSNIQVERYAVFFSNDNWASGWAIASTQTSAVVEGLESGTTYQFKVRADNDSLSVYSPWSNEVETSTTVVTTTTSSTTTSTTTTTEVPVTTTTEAPVFTLPPFLSTTTVPSTTTTTTDPPPTTTSTVIIQPPVVTTTIPLSTTTVPVATTTSTTTTTAPQNVVLGEVEDLTNFSQTQISSAVDDALSEGVDKDEAVAISTRPEILNAISSSQAKEIFEKIEVNSLTSEDKTNLSTALTSAPENVKQEFEGVIDIYKEGFDEYVPTGSNLDVGTRRTFLAATTVLSASITLGGGTGGSPAPSSGGSGGSNGGNTPNTPSSKKEEDMDAEEEDEPVEIEGPEGEDDEEVYTKNSIFKYEEGTMRKFSPWGFIKKFSRETAAMAFTISGSVIVFATLSGDTRKITLIATGCAFLVHYINVMLKNDE